MHCHCNHPLGIWACLWIIRVALVYVLVYWEFTRYHLRCVHVCLSSFPSEIDLNLVMHRVLRWKLVLFLLQKPCRTLNRQIHRGVANQHTNNRSLSPEDAQEPVILPHTQLYWFVHSCIFWLESISINVSSLTLLSLLMALTWFWTAHILE